MEKQKAPTGDVGAEELAAAFADKKTTDKIKSEELAEAFTGKKSEKTKKTLPIITFILGLIILVVGAGFLINKLMSGQRADDAERIISIGTFVKEGEEKVVWHFTEIGKGTLTTNGHINDYDFIWAIENGKLKIETAWLYDLNDEFDYKIDGDKLVLDGEIVFKPAPAN